MPWVWITILGKRQRIWVEDSYPISGGGGYVAPTLTVTVAVSVAASQQVTVSWTYDGTGIQTAANVTIKNAANSPVASVNINGSTQSTTLTLPEGNGYTAVVNVETYNYITVNGTGTSAAFNVGPPPPPPPPPIPPFVPSMGMMAA